MEFGWINLFGGIIVVLVLLPSIVYALKKRVHDDNEKYIPNILAACEQIGRYACMILMWFPLFIRKFGFGSTEELLLYFLLNGILIAAYYLGWARYLKEPSLKCGMMLAIIPAAVFLVSGLLLNHWLLAAAAVLFGISHCRITYITHSGKE